MHKKKRFYTNTTPDVDYYRDDEGYCDICFTGDFDASYRRVVEISCGKDYHHVCYECINKIKEDGDKCYQ